MAFKKRKSASITKARLRMSGLEAIDPNLDLGNGLTLADYQTAVEATEAKLDSYNNLLSKSDEAGNIVKSSEKTLRELSERILEGVGSKFGHDSNEYEMAGGKRTSERKRPVRKPKPTA